MENNACQQFAKLAMQMHQTNYKSVFTQAEETYLIRELKISTISPEEALRTYQLIHEKFRRHECRKQELNWWQNELRIYIWSLLAYLHLQNLTIEEMRSENWQFFSTIFPNKQLILFEYQSLNILKDYSNQNRKWLPEEDKIFMSLLRYVKDYFRNNDKRYKWSQWAKQLFIISNRKYFRAPKQCRERWLNHLDPTKSKKQWQEAQDYVLISCVRTIGKKWAQIAKRLRNRRNEHSIKNRYKSLITKQAKAHHEQQFTEQMLQQSIYQNFQDKLLSRSCCLDNQGYVKLQTIDDRHDQPTAATSYQLFPSQQCYPLFSLQQCYTLPQYNSCVSYSSLNQQQHFISFHQYLHHKQNIKQHSYFHVQPCNKNDWNDHNATHELAMISQSEEKCQNQVDRMENQLRQEKEKQIRADMLLFEDPFEFLIQHFKCKEEERAL